MRVTIPHKSARPPFFRIGRGRRSHCEISTALTSITKHAKRNRKKENPRLSCNARDPSTQIAGKVDNLFLRKRALNYASVNNLE